MISVPQTSTLLGLDVHKLTISAAVLVPGSDTPVVDKTSSDPEAVRRLVGRFEDPRRLVACYEAGPTGYELARQLRSMGVRCEGVAPSLIPVAPGDRIKTDKRDAQRLALLLRGGQLTAVLRPRYPRRAAQPLGSSARRAGPVTSRGNPRRATHSSCPALVLCCPPPDTSPSSPQAAGWKLAAQRSACAPQCPGSSGPNRWYPTGPARLQSRPPGVGQVVAPRGGGRSA